jgi:putative transposase
VLHRRREWLAARLPLHVTIRLQSGLPTLRQPRFVRAFRVSLSQACVRHGFRVVHYSIQRDHVHLLIEA